MKAVQQANAKVHLPGKLALVVGGTSGIGRGIALRLAQAQLSVTIVGRSKARGEEIVAEMQKLAPQGTHGFLPCDTMLMSNIRTFTSEYNAANQKLHYLVLSPGIATIQGRTETKEGIDEKLAVHYYGRIAMILGLLPVLERTVEEKEDVRVMSVLSGGVHKPYDKWEEDPDLKKNYSLKNAAYSAGFYTDLAFDALSVRHPTISWIHSAPGFVATNWGTELPAVLRWGARAMMHAVARSASDCAECMCYGLFQPQYGPGFHLVSSMGEPSKKTAVHNDRVRDFIWAHTLQVIGAAPEAGGAEAAAQPADAAAAAAVAVAAQPVAEQPAEQPDPAEDQSAGADQQAAEE
jgi:NAD(P)-dependent dehydrogenase (short-subunit alcohol dehydrogenase family)